MSCLCSGGGSLGSGILVFLVLLPELPVIGSCSVFSVLLPELPEIRSGLVVLVSS